MAKRNRGEAGLTNGGGSRPKRHKGQEMSPEVDISSDHAYSDGEEDGEKRGKEEVKQQGLRMWQTVKDATSKDHRVISALFLTPPDKRLYPDYYVYIQRPIALNEIKRKLTVLAYNTLDELKADFDLCFNNAQTYNDPSSAIYDDAKELQKLVAKLHKELLPAEKSEHKKHKQPSFRRTMKSLVNKLVALTDDTGRVLSSAFMELPSRTEWAIYYQQIKHPQCFDAILKRIKRKEYASTVEFADDVELVFSNCMTFNQDHSAIWEDALALQKEFRHLMSELPAPFAIDRYAKPSGPKIKIKMPVASTSRLPPTQSAAAPPKPLPATTTIPAQPAAQPTKPSTSGKASTSKPTPAPPTTKPVATSTPAHPPAPKAPAPKTVAAKAIEPKALRSSTVSKPPAAASNAATPLSQPPVNGTKVAPAPPATPAPRPVAAATFSHLSTPAQAPAAAAASAPTPAATVTTRSQVAALAQTQTKTVSHSPAPPAPVHQLDFVRLKSIPRGRPFVLSHRDGVKSWAIRLGPEEQTLSVSNVTFIQDDEDESSGDEDDMEVDDQPAAKPKRGRGRPPKTKSETAGTKVKSKGGKKKPKLGEIQVKLNGQVKDGDGKDKWNIPVPIGNSTLEVGEKGGLIWKIYTQRVA
ncbi:Bromodomain-containing protein [Hymenopellis radicata]|nr:Bromodomain-containing protein [Hymenopellis radicata]